MRFAETPLKGAFLVDVERHADRRGFFARTFCARELEAHGLNPTVAQCNLSYNERAGTVRGLHYQVPPAAETKLVSCVRGAIYDVIVDLREDSPTYLQHVGVELTATNRRALYVPERFAHGFQTLSDETDVLYLMGAFYAPGFDRGLRFDDPVLHVAWPLEVSEISEKDRGWPLLPARARDGSQPADLGLARQIGRNPR